MESITKGQAFGDAFPLQKKNIFFSFYLTKAEMAALTWDDVNFKENTITINKTVNRYRKADYGFTMAVACLMWTIPGISVGRYPAFCL